MPVAILTLLGAAALYAARGRAPGGERDPVPGLGYLLVWSGLFGALAIGGLLAVWGPDADPGPGGETGGLIVGIMGAVFAVGGLLAMAANGSFSRGRPAASGGLGQAARLAHSARGFRGADLATLASQTGPTPAAVRGGDLVTRLERLEHLRASGAISEAEFERLKAQVIGGAR